MTPDRDRRVARAPAPWWTAADNAELDLLVREFVDALFSHDQRCPQCIAQLAGTSPNRCKEFGEVVTAIVEWRELRSAASFAIAMRRLQNTLDADVVAA